MGVIHNTHQQLAIAITSGLLFFTTVIVGIRLYIRCILLKAGSAEINSGLGRHITDLTKEEIHSFELSLFIVIQFYSVGLNVVKISFLIQFYRIFPDRRVRQICVYFAFFSFLWMIGQNILYALSCVPTTGLVNNPHLKDICVPTLPVWTAISCINVGTDLIIFSIPLKPLWEMPLLRRQRYLLIGIFCFGFVVVIISVVRIPTLRHGASSPDPTFTNVQTALWSLAELETAILCTSLPILRPIVARFMRGVAPPDAADEHMKGPHGQVMNVEDVRHGPRQLPGESLLIPTAMTGSTLKSLTQQFKSKTSTIGEQEISLPPLPSSTVNDGPPREPEPEEWPVPDPLGSKPLEPIKDFVTRSSVGPLRSPSYEEMLPPHFLDNGAPRPKARMITRGTQTMITWDPLVDPFQVPEAIEEPSLKEIDLEANKAGARVTQERAETISESKETISPLLADARDRNRENTDARSLASRSTRGNRRAVGMSWLRLSGDSGFNSSRYWER
ncbi:hypothetical protein KVR01_006157 [Diaporthe batatas]|uniref:uncharacterized protein n=1 Tax=Diaporthe batatas TaxID=748121 RepID=UPI001D0590A7|nr:uncharacterized protein KVR01_006157 [Diaporthe batatas]KAG8164239.1 hypothetical protein KVR01_006157 [Diaporthe batatas]